MAVVSAGGPSAASVVRTIRNGGFTGEVYSVARNHSAPPAAVDLVIIDLPAERVIEVVAPAARSRAGVSSFVSLGSHGDVGIDDLLEYWEDDEATGVICLQAELALHPLIAPSSGVVVQAGHGRISPRARPEPWLRHLP